MKLVVNMMLGCMTTTFSEAIGLCEKSGLNREEFFDVLGAGALQSPWYTIKVRRHRMHACMRAPLPPTHPSCEEDRAEGQRSPHASLGSSI